MRKKPITPKEEWNNSIDKGIGKLRDNIKGLEKLYSEHRETYERLSRESMSPAFRSMSPEKKNAHRNEFQTEEFDMHYIRIEIDDLKSEIEFEESRKEA